MKQWPVVLSVFGITIFVGVALWFFIGPKIPLDKTGNLVVDIPEKFSLKQDIFASALANLEQGKILGRAVFVPGDYPVPISGEIYRLLVPEQPTSVEYSVEFSCETLSTEGGKMTLKPLISELSFHFSPKIGIGSPQGLHVDLEKITVSDENDLKKMTISTDLKIAESLASFFLYLFINTDRETSDQATQPWLSLFQEISVTSCHLTLKEQAVIPFNQNSLVTGPSCELILRDFSLQDAGNMEGLISVNLTLSSGSVFDLGEIVLRPDQGNVVFDGMFKMKHDVLSVTINQRSETNFITIRNVRVRQKGDQAREFQKHRIAVSEGAVARNNSPHILAGSTASPSKNVLSSPQKALLSGPPAKKRDQTRVEKPSENTLTLDIKEVNFTLINYEYVSSSGQEKEKTKLELQSSLTTAKGVIPLDNGILSFSSLRVPNFKFVLDEDAAVPGQGPTLILPLLTFENAKLVLEQSAEETISIDMNRFQSRNVTLEGLQDGQLTIDSTQLSLTRVLFQRKNDTIDIAMGAKSRIELGENNLRFLLNPSKTAKSSRVKEQAVLIGQMHIKGVVPTLAATFGETAFQFDRVNIDLNITLAKQPSIDGSFSAIIPAQTIAASMTDIPPPEVKNMQFNPPRVSNLGAMKFSGQFMLVGEMNTSRFDISMNQFADFLLTGKALRNSDINLQVFCSAFQTTIHLGKEAGKFSLAMAIKNNASSCIHEEKKKILTGTARERFYLEPFETLHLDIQGDVTVVNNSLVIKPKTWQQTNDQKIVIKAKGDIGSHSISASLSDKKTNCNVFGIDLPEWVCPGNLLRDELNKLCKKEYIISF